MTYLVKFILQKNAWDLQDICTKWAANMYYAISVNIIISSSISYDLLSIDESSLRKHEINVDREHYRA